MTDERIMLLNPNTGREDTRIERRLYDPVKDAILSVLAEEDEVMFKDLGGHVRQRTPAELWQASSIGWYTTSVKLDLEARGLVEREGSPQRLRLTPQGRKAASA